MLPEEFIKRSYSLAYAVFRLSDGINNPAISNNIEEEALRLVNAGLDGSLSDTRKLLRSLEYVVALGRDAGHIYPYGAELLLAEIEALREDIQDRKPEPKFKEKDPKPAFEELPKDRPVKVAPVEEKRNSVSADVESGNPAIAEFVEPSSLTRQSDEGFEIRRDKIIERIRQSGNCRMRDIQEVMGGVSERTLRYDLQRLVVEGIIERIGTGGPATYYRIK